MVRTYVEETGVEDGGLTTATGVPEPEPDTFDPVLLEPLGGVEPTEPAEPSAGAKPPGEPDMEVPVAGDSAAATNWVLFAGAAETAEAEGVAVAAVADGDEAEEKDVPL